LLILSAGCFSATIGKNEFSGDFLFANVSLSFIIISMEKASDLNHRKPRLFDIGLSQKKHPPTS
jgi:hypothetical protein